MKPFSYNTRNCIGKNLAYAKMRFIIAKLVWKFELELTPESKNWFEEQKIYIIFQKPPLFIKLHLAASEERGP